MMYRIKFDKQISVNLYSKQEAISFKKYLNRYMPGKVKLIKATDRGCSI